MHLILHTFLLLHTPINGMATIFPNSCGTTGNQTHVSLVARLWGTSTQGALPTELPQQTRQRFELPSFGLRSRRRFAAWLQNVKKSLIARNWNFLKLYDQRRISSTIENFERTENKSGTGSISRCRALGSFKPYFFSLSQTFKKPKLSSLSLSSNPVLLLSSLIRKPVGWPIAKKYGMVCYKTLFQKLVLSQSFSKWAKRGCLKFSDYRAYCKITESNLALRLKFSFS